MTCSHGYSSGQNPIRQAWIPGQDSTSQGASGTPLFLGPTHDPWNRLSHRTKASLSKNQGACLKNVSSTENAVMNGRASCTLIMQNEKTCKHPYWQLSTRKQRNQKPGGSTNPGHSSHRGSRRIEESAVVGALVAVAACNPHALHKWCHLDWPTHKLAVRDSLEDMDCLRAAENQP